jgi:hypothetical protein
MTEMGQTTKSYVERVKVFRLVSYNACDMPACFSRRKLLEQARPDANRMSELRTLQPLIDLLFSDND